MIDEQAKLLATLAEAQGEVIAWGRESIADFGRSPAKAKIKQLLKLAMKQVNALEDDDKPKPSLLGRPSKRTRP